MTNKDKFLALVSIENTNTIENAKERIAKRDFYRISSEIAIKILSRLDELNLTKEELSEKLNVPIEQVNKWVKGSYNFDLETIVKIEKLLEAKIL